MVNAEKQRRLIADKETRLKKQILRKCLISNNAKKDFKRVKKEMETQHQTQNKIIAYEVENKQRKLEDFIN